MSAEQVRTHRTGQRAAPENTHQQDAPTESLAHGISTSKSSPFSVLAPKERIAPKLIFPDPLTCCSVATVGYCPWLAADGW